MTDKLIDSQILGIWERIKTDIDFNNITALDKTNQKRQLKDELNKIAKKSENFQPLIDGGLQNEIVERDSLDLRKELITSQIVERLIKGNTRYAVAKGTPSFNNIRGGQLLAGKTKDDALKDLQNKTS